MKKDIKDISGFINESELVSLAGNDAVGAGTPVAIATAIIVATYMAGACPTSACTKSCNK